MMDLPLEHACAIEIPKYLAVKRLCLRDGLFSCSQQGFNIAMNQLVGLRYQLAEWFASLVTDHEQWSVPALIRSDWVPRNAWQRPAEDLWCTEQPGKHLLTPRPLFHLLNRLRHHSQTSGTWLLTGACTRNEDPTQTLPLLLQRSFTMIEAVALAPRHSLGIWHDDLLKQIWEQAVAWDLPATLSGEEEGNVTLSIELASGEQPSLTRSWYIDAHVLDAYHLGEHSIVTIGSGLERWCLAILARYGTNPKQWPEELQPSTVAGT